MTKGANLILYTDGGASGANGKAGCASIVEDHQKKKRYLLSGFLGDATNNEAEIFALILGLSFIQKFKEKEHETYRLRVVADSEYVIKSASNYIGNWQKNGWKTADKKPVKNKNLWKLYLTLVKDFSLEFEHVYGHTGHEQNEACDLAVQWAKENAEEVFSFNEEIIRTEIETGLKNKKWIVFDLRKTITQIRGEDFIAEEEKELSGLIDKMIKAREA